MDILRLVTKDRGYNTVENIIYPIKHITIMSKASIFLKILYFLISK